VYVLCLYRYLHFPSETLCGIWKALIRKNHIILKFSIICHTGTALENIFARKKTHLAYKILEERKHFMFSLKYVSATLLLFTPNPAAVADFVAESFYKAYLCAGEAFDEAAAVPVPHVRLQEWKSVRSRLPLPVPHGEPRV
jgi:hypothetical protein